MLKLGSQTGSLTNHIMSSQNDQTPVVGEYANHLLWTDRHAYKVIEVTKNGKQFVGEHGGHQTTFYFKWGAWRRKGISIVVAKELIAQGVMGREFNELYKSKGGTYDGAFPQDIIDGVTEQKIEWHKIEFCFTKDADEYYDPHF